MKQTKPVTFKTFPRFTKKTEKFLVFRTDSKKAAQTLAYCFAGSWHELPARIRQSKTEKYRIILPTNEETLNLIK